MTSFKIYPGQRNAIYTICNIHYSAIPTTPTKILKSYKRKGHDTCWLTHPCSSFQQLCMCWGGWKVANYVPVNWSYAWWWGNFNEPNKLNSCPSRADGLSIKYLYKRTTTCDWEKSSEPCDLKCGPRMVEINVCFVFQSQKSMKCINFVKEARNTTGLETLKTSKACDNWAEAFFSNKDRNTNVQEDMYLEVIGRAV